MYELDKNESELVLRNHMEGVVSNMLKEMLPKLDICKCNACQLDIMAYALNHLPPKYIVTSRGDLYSRLAEFTQQFEVDVQIAITEAIKIVSSNPRHRCAGKNEVDRAL